MRPSLLAFLESNGLGLADVHHLAAHPGGVKVLNAYAAALDLPPEVFRHAREVLREYGNMSSPSCLFVLERFLAVRRDRRRGPRDRGRARSRILRRVRAAARRGLVIGVRVGGAVPWRPLVLFLVVLAVQRAGELVHSGRNVRRLKKRGAIEHGAGHFPLLVLVHVLFPLALVAEVVGLGSRPGELWPFALGFWLAAQVLRYSAVSALGERWSVGVWVLPGEPLVRRGPYRFLRHPNYVAVVTELFAAPLMFGAWRTAIAITILNALALAHRIRTEEAALREASGASGSAR